MSISGLIILGAFGGTGYLFGSQIGSELQDVVSRADTALKDISTSMQKSEFDSRSGRLQSPLAHGVIAGMADFIRYVGPMIASVPTVLVATPMGCVLFWGPSRLIFFTNCGEILVPLIRRRIAYIPPALMLLGIVTISTPFGAGAIIFAAPIVVIPLSRSTTYTCEKLSESRLAPRRSIRLGASATSGWRGLRT